MMAIMNMPARIGIKALAAALTLLAVFGGARAEDKLTIAIGQHGNWENSAPELGQRMGFFKKHGLALDLLYTQGSAETMQAVIAGSADIGIGVGTTSAMGAFARGAPVLALANHTTGAPAAYWYVPENSPIKSFKDLDGKTVGFSTTGSSSYTALLQLAKLNGVTPKPVATGNPASTFTQAMSGQVDVGWSSPPFGLQAAERRQDPHHRPRQRRAGAAHADGAAADHQQRRLRAERGTRSSAISPPIARRWTGCIPIPPRSRCIRNG